MVKDSPKILKLDLCGQLTSCLLLLFATTHESYTQTAVETTLVLLRAFGEVIQQTCLQAATSVGVDLSFDERKSKCQSVKDGLKQLCHPLQCLIDRSDKPQHNASRLLELLTQL